MSLRGILRDLWESIGEGLRPETFSFDNGVAREPLSKRSPETSTAGATYNETYTCTDCAGWCDCHNFDGRCGLCQ